MPASIVRRLGGTFLREHRLSSAAQGLINEGGV
jgi:hypothetical protein